MVDWQTLLVGEEAVKNPKVPIGKPRVFNKRNPSSVPEKAKKKTRKKKDKPTQAELWKKFGLENVDFDSIPDFTWRGCLNKPKVMFVSDSPSFFELKYGFAFCGDAGLELSRAAFHAGLNVGDFEDIFSGVQRELRFDREDWNREYQEGISENYDKGEVLFWHTDFTGKSGQGKDKKNKTENEEILFKSCAHFHYHVVATIQPEHIIFLGAGIFKAVFGKTNPQAYAGVPFSYKVPWILEESLKAGNEDEVLKELVNTPYECPADVDIHPAMALQRGLENAFRERLRLYVNRRSEGASVEVFEPEYTVFEDYESSRDYLSRMIENPLERLCYDFETITLTPTAFLHKDGATVSAHFTTDGKHGYSIPTWHPDVDMTREQRITLCKMIGELLLKDRDDTFLHNSLFDNLTARVDPHMGIQSRRLPGRILDTMIMAYVLDETAPKDLKVLCNLYTPFKNYDEELDQYKKQHKPENYGQIPWGRILGRYGAYDVIGTWVLLEELLEKLRASQEGNVYNIATQMVPVHLQALEDMAVMGQCMDRDLIFKVDKNHTDLMRELEKAIFSTEEMQVFTESQRLKNSVDFALGELLKPLNTLKKAISLGIVKDSQNEKREYRKKFTEIRDNVKQGRLKIELDGEVVKLPSQETDTSSTKLLKPIYETFCKEKYEETGNYKPNLNTNGSGEMGEFFFEHLKLPVEFFTDTGAPSLDKEAVPFLATLHPVANLYGDWSKFSREHKMYVAPLVKSFKAFDAGEVYHYPMSVDGFTHFSTFIGTTVTGRATAEYLQLTPRKGDVKKFFRSRFKRGLIPQADLSQIELRIAAAVSRDSKMVEAYVNGEDLHSKTATLIFGTKFTDCMDPVLKKELRAGSKRTNFGTLYGSGADGLVQTIKQEGVDPLTIGGYDPETVKEQVRQQLRKKFRRDPKRYEVEKVLDKLRAEVTAKMLRDFYASYPELKEWIDSCHEFTLANGYYFNPFGRIRHLPAALNNYDKGSQNEALRQAQNFAIQSAAADVMFTMIAAIELEMIERKLRTVPIATVHDSFELDSPLEESVEAIEIVLHYMRNPAEAFKKTGLDSYFDLSWLNGIPIEADAELGPSWGEAYVYEEGSLKLMSEEDGDPEDLWVPVEEFWNVIEDVRSIKEELAKAS